MPDIFEIKRLQKNLKFAVFLGILCVLPCANSAIAETGSVVDILPAASQENYMAPEKDDVTHPPLRLTPDKSELIRLDQDAGSVILGNPEHATILAESPSLLVVVPKMPGATYFTILGSDGNVIMQRHVIVASPKEDYVRVRKSCLGSQAAADDSCTETNIYYCPDMCHNIVPSIEEDKAANNANSNDDKKSQSGNAAASDDGSDSEAVDE